MMCLLPTCYFPPINYFIYLNFYNCTIEIQENYIKQTYRNRCNILSANGKLSLIVPIKHTKNKTINSLEISYSENWQKQHHKSLQAAYQRSPYYEFYEEKFNPIFTTKYKYLKELNNSILKICLTLLEISIDIPQQTTKYFSNINGLDLRNSFSPKILSEKKLPPYSQVFEDRFLFQENLSIFDLICNLGPQSKSYLIENQINKL